MSKESHTPGPWEYYPARNYDGFAIAPRGTLPTLAAVERPRGNPNTLNVTAFNFPGQTEANARLIAAAPALLEAAKTAFVHEVGARLATAVERNGWKWPDDAPATVSIPAERLRAAIQSATGEG